MMGMQVHTATYKKQLLAAVAHRDGSSSPQHTFARTYLAEHPGDVVGLATLWEHTSLDTTRIYSQPTLSQLAPRIEQLPQDAYANE